MAKEKPDNRFIDYVYKVTYNVNILIDLEMFVVTRDIEAAIKKFDNYVSENGKKYKAIKIEKHGIVFNGHDIFIM